MIRLLFIVPYPELEKTIRYILENHPEKGRISADVLVRSVDEVERLSVTSYDAAIARGYSARLLRSAFPHTPVVDMVISGYDIMRTVMECKNAYGAKRIAVCGFFGKIYEAAALGREFGCEMELYSPDTYRELEKNVEEAKRNGCDALIGGFSSGRYAQKYQLPFRLIRTGEDTVFLALNEAIRTVEEVRKERLRSETYKTIIDSSKNGILFVDCRGAIQVRNHTARTMNRQDSLMNKPLKEVFPLLYPAYKEALASGQEIGGRIFKLPGSQITVSVSFTPVIVNNTISGIVILMSDITQVQKLEGQIRRTLSQKGLRAKHTFEDIIHESEIMDATIETARRYALSESNVILVGETGTGKELFAQSIHNASNRKSGPFVAINCAALPENLLESELFGYVEGAFTGTVKGGKMGLFEQAHGGTLFLDEIGEISMAIQTKLLRALQEREIRRIGDNKVISVDVRIVSATNKSIHKLAEQGLFRRDLAYRLDVLRIFLPPLRKRGEDISLLFLRLLQQLGREQNCPVPRVEAADLKILREHSFLGNVRELQNVAERVWALRNGGRITARELAAAMEPPDLEMDADTGKEKEKVLEEGLPDERAMIQQALALCRGNQTKAAKMLGIDRSTLWRKMKKYG